jgi:hypothetical protein
MHTPGLLLASGFLVGTVVTATSQAVGWAYPGLRSHLERFAPEDRSLLLRFLALLPWVLALGIVILAFLPSFITIPGWIEDHCLPHEHHPHLCMRHGVWMPSGPLWVSLGAFAVLGLVLWIRLLHRTLRSQQIVQTLMRVSQRRGTVQVIPTRHILAFSAGLLHPQTVISKGVLEKLDASELEVVLAHEEAHAKRKDALWRVLLEALLLGLPRANRSLLLEDYTLACEEACDRKSFSQTVTPGRVAEVLLRMQRLGCIVQPEGMPGVTGAHLIHRVKALLGDPYPPRPKWMRLVWITPMALLLVEPVHHAAESLLGLILS